MYGCNWLSQSESLILIKPQNIEKVLGSIANPEIRDQGVVWTLDRLQNVSTMTEDQVNGFLPIISNLSQMEDSLLSCRALVCALKILDFGKKHDSLAEHILHRLRTTWQQIDVGWVRIDAGFGIARDLASFRPD